MTDKQQVCERVVHTELSSLKCHNHMCLCDVMAHRRESRDTVAKEECMDVGRAASLRWMLAEKWTGRTGAFQRVPWQMWPSHVMPLLHTCYAGTSAPGGKGLFPSCAAVLPPPPARPRKRWCCPPAPPRAPPCTPVSPTQKGRHHACAMARLKPRRLRRPATMRRRRRAGARGRVSPRGTGLGSGPWRLGHTRRTAVYRTQDHGTSSTVTSTDLQRMLLGLLRSCWDISPRQQHCRKETTYHKNPATIAIGLTSLPKLLEKCK